MLLCITIIRIICSSISSVCCFYLCTIIIPITGATKSFWEIMITMSWIWWPFVVVFPYIIRAAAAMRWWMSCRFLKLKEGFIFKSKLCPSLLLWDISPWGTTTANLLHLKNNILFFVARKIFFGLFTWTAL